MNEADNQAETAVSVNYEIPDKSEPGQSDPGSEYPSVGGKQLELFQEKLLAPESRSRHKLIGQLFDTYWLWNLKTSFTLSTSMPPMKKCSMSAPWRASAHRILPRRP